MKSPLGFWRTTNMRISLISRPPHKFASSFLASIAKRQPAQPRDSKYQPIL